MVRGQSGRRHDEAGERHQVQPIRAVIGVEERPDHRQVTRRDARAVQLTGNEWFRYRQHGTLKHPE